MVTPLLNLLCFSIFTAVHSLLKSTSTGTHGSICYVRSMPSFQHAILAYRSRPQDVLTTLIKHGLWSSVVTTSRHSRPSFAFLSKKDQAICLGVGSRSQQASSFSGQPSALSIRSIRTSTSTCGNTRTSLTTGASSSICQFRLVSHH